MTDRRIILASASPRRQELLRVLVPSFDVVPSQVQEEAYQGGLTPAEYAVDLADRKAAAVAARCGGEGVIIGADTIVLCEGRILNKPADAREAAEMLRALSGKTHAVITGLCVIDAASSVRLREPVRTRVRIRPMREAEIQAYIATGEPMDKAGAYAIQGKAALFIEGIEGCYFNVVGLPLFTLGQMLEKIGIRCL